MRQSEFIIKALEKMFENAPCEYTEVEEQYGKYWFNVLTWTQEDSDSFKKWFFDNYKGYGNKKRKRVFYESFNVIWGFKIENK